jgi:hypothetical protein
VLLLLIFVALGRNRTAVHIFNEQSDYKNVGLRLNKVKEKRFLSLYKNVGKVFRVKRDETAELPTKST